MGTPASRASVQRWLLADRISVDGRAASASAKVGVGSVVVVAPLDAETTDLEPDASVPFDILHEDAHLIVVDKPGGVVVHPARGHAHKTLVHGLLARGSFSLVRAAEGDPLASVRPGIVHRLDKGTSGVMVIAKDEATREGLKAQFADRDIERAYVALVVGHVEDARFDTLHGRHRTDRLRFTTHVSTGKRAVTRVHVIERLGAGVSLVECRLETGRTHQIRVHLAECANAPILGDPLYGRPPRDPWLRRIGEELGRQALHATLLGFVHPETGERLVFRRDPPLDFTSALRTLGGKVPPRLS